MRLLRKQGDGEEEVKMAEEKKSDFELESELEPQKRKKALRLTRTTADRLVSNVIERARAINADPDMLNWVTKVALFGSHLKGKERPGDVDIAYQLQRRESDGARWRKAAMERVRAAHAAGRRFSTYIDELGWDQDEVRLKLKNRSAGLSLHGWWDLEGLIRETKGTIEYRLIYEYQPHGSTNFETLERRVRY